MAKDPYRYFRIEAQELIEELSRGLLELDKGAGHEVVRQLLRHAHTFKGAARVVKEVGIAELAHQIEDLLSPFRDNAEGLDPVAVSAGLALVDQIRVHCGALGLQADATENKDAAPAKPFGEESLKSIRVGIGDLDGLIEGITAAHTASATLSQVERMLEQSFDEAQALGQALASSSNNGDPGALTERVDRLVQRLGQSRRELQNRSEQVARELRELQATTSELRLIPAQVLVNELERAVRDTGQALGKKVSFQTSGTGTRIDAAVLSALRGALRHVVGNAVAHGIEDEKTRLRAGKPPVGTVAVSVERRGHRVAFVCEDDGRGVDLETIRQTALDRGLVSEEAASSLDLKQAIDLLLRGGLSTAGSVTPVSGRGIGLDVVRATLEGLKGEVDIRSTPHRGTVVELLVPLSLFSLPALAVEWEENTVLIPLDSVKQTVKIRPQDLTLTAEGQRLFIEGEGYPFLPLGKVLRGSIRPGEPEAPHAAVVMRSFGRQAVIGVESIGGIRNVVVRSLPEYLTADPAVAGAAVDDQGKVQLVLSPAVVVQTALLNREAPSAPRLPDRPPVLVIDDSITTRMLEQSILESAGYEVDLAVSAEDALQKVRLRRYGLFVVDIEMPGMDGFQFVAKTRADPDLKDIPSILVTSRKDSQDKLRGKEVGARAYIVKSEFDQQQLLEIIQGLIG